MNIKSSKLLAIILILVAAGMMLSGCGRSGQRFANILPTITITSYEGWTHSNVSSDPVSDEELINWADSVGTSFAFQQRIYWHATDPDGVVTGYAFRVLDETRRPIPTPGYRYISDSSKDELTPRELLERYGDGWVIHYMTGADQSFALDDPEARRSIWTSKKSAVINFPSADEFGNPIPKISFFEVVAIDNRGGITEESAWRIFKTESPRPTCMITTTKGNPAGGDVGSGLRLKFAMDDTDPFIPAIPYKFEFRMMKADADTVEIPGTSTGWITSNGDSDIDEYQLTRYTNPALTYDYDGGTATSFTMVTARATDMAGVVSDTLFTTPLIFRVKPGFHPFTQIYSQRLLVLGDNHYVDYMDDNQEALPNVAVHGDIHYANPFYRNFDGMLSAVHSPNIKAYVRWGWWGEYGIESANGITYPKDDPYGKKIDTVLDSRTGANYYSEITAFDIRYDDEPYHFPPFAHSIYTDPEDGRQWLRLPIYSPLLQSIVLTGAQMDPGIHKFEVRCVDLQDEPDPNPAVIQFEILEYIPPVQREGILIIDDDFFGSTPSAVELEAEVNARYEYMFADYISNGGSVTIVNRDPDNPNNGTFKDVRDRQVAFSELSKYKLVVYHSDNTQKSGNLEYDPDAFALYLLNGGNLLISHSAKLSSVMDGIARDGIRSTMLKGLGLTNFPRIKFVSNSYNTNTFFQYADGLHGYPRIDLQFGEGENANPMNMLINTRHGLGPVSYFTELGTATPIHSYGCKPVDYTPFPPTQAQYDTYHGKTVGIRNLTNSGGKTYTLGFPLSFMKKDDAKAFVNKVLSEVM